MTQNAPGVPSPFFSRVRPRLLMLVLVALVPAFALILYQGRQSGHSAAQHASAQADRVQLAARAEFARGVEETRQLFAFLSARFGAYLGSPRDCAGLLAALRPMQHFYANLGVALPNGDLYCGALPAAGRINYRDRLWFQRALATRRFTVGELVIGRVVGKPVLVLAQPHYDAAARLQAVFFAALDLAWLNRYVENAQLPPGSIITLLDQHGVVLSRSVDAAKWVGRKHDGEIARTILARRGAGTAEARGLDGVERFYAFAPLYTVGDVPAGYVSVGIPSQAAYANAHRIAANAVTGLVVVLILVLALAWVGGNLLLVNPLRALVATVRRFGAGDLAARTQLAYAGEFGEVARALDHMAMNLHARGRALERTGIELRNSSELFELMFDATHFLIAYLDCDFNFIRVNRAYAAADGRPAEFFPGKNHFALYPQAENEAIFRRVVATGAAHTELAKPFQYAHAPERGVSWWDWTLSPLKDADDRVRGLLLGLVDVTERIKAEQRAGYLQYHDPLTGLPNRALLDDRLRQAVAEGERRGSRVAVLCLDLDRFKYINDTLGHVAGDMLLKVAAERLTQCVRQSDTVARVEGDEFVAVIGDMASADDAGKVISKLMGCGAKPFVHDGQDYFMTMSVGVALFPLDGREPELLLKCADLAMHDAKARGGNGYQFYSQEMAQRAGEHLQMENSLRLALERGEFLLYYQPQLDIASGRVLGAEALIRWRHPEWGLVSPTRFIPVAEETGLIDPLGEWVLRAACAQVRAWQEQGLPPLRVAVNVSVQQFRYNDLAHTVERTLRDCGLAADCIEVEVTESVLAPGDDTYLAMLRRIADLGVHISIDDFGTGYSGLAYLRRFPIHCVKIDQSFVRDLTSSADAGAIVTAILAMARTLGIRTVAEGVETPEQLEFLRTHGCDIAQGFHFSPPVPAEEFAGLVRMQSRCTDA